MKKMILYVLAGTIVFFSGIKMMLASEEPLLPEECQGGTSRTSTRTEETREEGVAAIAKVKAGLPKLYRECIDKFRRGGTTSVAEHLAYYLACMRPPKVYNGPRKVDTK